LLCYAVSTLAADRWRTGLRRLVRRPVQHEMTVGGMKPIHVQESLS
jgi:hypothetical protein